MKIIIHRGAYQIGGIAVEIKTTSTRIIIDMGDELTMDKNYECKHLNIPGVTDENGKCDGVFFSHYHGDHVGQLPNIRKGIPLYMGSLTRKILLATGRNIEQEVINKINKAVTFVCGKRICIGNIFITPLLVDHSACDNYMFFVEADGKKVLFTGDFRMHGFRGNKIPYVLNRYVKKVDILITEGTNISRNNKDVMTEMELQNKVKEYLGKYKYVFALASSTNLERIYAFSKAVEMGKYFICDGYQSNLLDLYKKYRNVKNIKKTVYGNNLLSKFQYRGFLMMVRDNKLFRKIIPLFDKNKSIMLYSMWDGYRRQSESTLPEFLSLAGSWEYLHTSGHAFVEDIKQVIEIVKPSYIIPIHTDKPELMSNLFQDRNVIIAKDGQEIDVLD